LFGGSFYFWISVTNQIILHLNKNAKYFSFRCSNAITRNLLNLAQADFEITEQNREEIRFDELLYEIKEYFDKSIYKNRLAIHFNGFPGTSKSLSIYGIRYMLNTALTNVLENALKFSGDQSVDVLLKNDSGNITLMISDKGIGIPENELKDPFPPFQSRQIVFSFILHSSLSPIHC
jgi:signal transduction histidine kinase